MVEFLIVAGVSFSLSRKSFAIVVKGVLSWSMSIKVSVKLHLEQSPIRRPDDDLLMLLDEMKSLDNGSTVTLDDAMRPDGPLLASYIITEALCESFNEDLCVYELVIAKATSGLVLPPNSSDMFDLVIVDHCSTNGDVKRNVLDVFKGKKIVMVLCEDKMSP